MITKTFFIRLHKVSREAICYHPANLKIPVKDILKHLNSLNDGYIYIEVSESCVRRAYPPIIYTSLCSGVVEKWYLILLPELIAQNALGL